MLAVCGLFPRSLAVRLDLRNMFVKIRRKQFKLRRSDYKRVKGSPYFELQAMTKDDLKFKARAEPHRIVAVPRYGLFFELLESYRNAAGKPRTKVIAYLASMSEADLTTSLLPLAKRERFWRAIDAKLKPLNLARPAEAKIRKKINDRIPRPNEVELQSEYSVLLKEMR